VFIQLRLSASSLSSKQQKVIFICSHNGTPPDNDNDEKQQWLSWNVSMFNIEVLYQKQAINSHEKKRIVRFER